LSALISLAAPLVRKLLSGTALVLGAGAICIAAIPGGAQEGLRSDPQHLSSPRANAPTTLTATTRWKASIAVLELEKIPIGAQSSDLGKRWSEPATKSQQSIQGNKLALTLVVSVLDPKGRPIPRAEVMWYRVDSAGFPTEQGSACDIQGIFESARLADGRYRIRARAEGYRSSEAQEVDIPRVLGEPIRLVLNPARPQD
jgi:carboxypeptidase family protein